MQARAVFAAVVSVTLLAAPAAAQRREGARVAAVFSIELPVCVKFGEVSVPARRYRLTLGPAGFALADPATMVLVATLPFTEDTLQAVAAEPSAAVERSRDRVSIVLRYGDRVYTAAGTATTEQERLPQVMLAKKPETLLEHAGPEQQTELALVDQALKRYIGSIKHCADGAHRGRWGTNDPRFVKCVCPIMEKWRLPRVGKPLRVHHPLAKGRSGFSLTATPEGRAIDCNVWIGPSSPEQQDAATPPAAVPPEPLEAPAAQPPAAVTPSNQGAPVAPTPAEAAPAPAVP